MSELTQDELHLIDEYRSTKKMGHAHGEWDIKNGLIVKLWITKKVDLEHKNGEKKLVEVTSNGLNAKGN
jgi:hypothetical protein